MSTFNKNLSTYVLLLYTIPRIWACRNDGLPFLVEANSYHRDVKYLPTLQELISSFQLFFVWQPYINNETYIGRFASWCVCLPVQHY